MSATLGLLPIEAFDLLDEVWRGGIRVSSNSARREATALAQLASMGLITTQTAHGEFGSVWHVTPAGLEIVWYVKGLEE